MSLYTMIHGRNASCDLILATLGLTRADCGRFRDAFVTEDDMIAVYTRNGGSNRDDYQPLINKLAMHPCYLKDEDDDFDCTYCTIWFKFPDEYADDLKKLSTGPFEPSARWKKALDDVRAGKPEALEALKPLAEFIENALEKARP